MVWGLPVSCAKSKPEPIGIGRTGTDLTGPGFLFKFFRNGWGIRAINESCKYLCSPNDKIINQRVSEILELGNKKEQWRSNIRIALQNPKSTSPFCLNYMIIEGFQRHLDWKTKKNKWRTKIQIVLQKPKSTLLHVLLSHNDNVHNSHTMFLFIRLKNEIKPRLVHADSPEQHAKALSTSSKRQIPESRTAEARTCSTKCDGLHTKNNQRKNKRLTARFHVQILHPLFESKWILLSAKTTCSIELPPWKSTKLCVSMIVYWIRIPLCTLQGAGIISNWVSAEPRGLLKFLCHFHEHCLQLLHAVAFVLCSKQKTN